MLEDGDRKCVCQRWGAISSNYSAAGDNLADDDYDDEDCDDDDGIINADDNQSQMTKMTMITTLMTNVSAMSGM